MLVSHRVHGPYWDGDAISLDRVFGEGWVVRRAAATGLATDDRITAPLGRGLSESRARLSIVFGGRMTLRGSSGREVMLAPGDFALRSRIDAAQEACDGETLEIDFECPTDLPAWSQGRLGRRTRLAMCRLSDATRLVEPTTTPQFRAVLDAGLEALAAEGLSVRLVRAASPGGAEEQRTMTALDRALSTLATAPALVDLEASLTCNRRTVVRRIHALHSRHAIHGIGGTDFRSVRDFYRLLVACILASSPHATTEGLARAVGYASPAALCHAFDRVGLPTPGAIRARIRDWTAHTR